MSFNICSIYLFICFISLDHCYVIQDKLPYSLQIITFQRKLLPPSPSSGQMSYPEEGGSMVLQIIGIYLQTNMTSHLRRIQSSYNCENLRSLLCGRYSLHHSHILISQLFYSEDGGSWFLQNIGTCITLYGVTVQKINLFTHWCENLKSHSVGIFSLTVQVPVKILQKETLSVSHFIRL